MARLRLIALSALILPLFIGCSGTEEGATAPDGEDATLRNWATDLAGKKNAAETAHSWGKDLDTWQKDAVYRALLSYCDLEKIIVNNDRARFQTAGFRPYCSLNGPYSADTDPPPPPGPPPGWGD